MYISSNHQQHFLLVRDKASSAVFFRSIGCVDVSVKHNDIAITFSGSWWLVGRSISTRNVAGRKWELGCSRSVCVTRGCPIVPVLTPSYYEARSSSPGGPWIRGSRSVSFMVSISGSSDLKRQGRISLSTENDLINLALF